MKTTGSFQPFRHLKQLLQRSHTPIEMLPAERFICKTQEEGRGDPDQLLFERAMADVVPLWKAERLPDKVPAAPKHQQSTENDLTMNALHELVHTGRGYRVADTPEYIEGTGYQVPPGIARELHRGTFSIQAHIDLHGMTVPIACEAFSAFMRDALQRGYRAVLVVHGRGLSSPTDPVLKSKVVQWLTSGTWRKWVLAYTSARPCDGAAGATYVLLRSRPLTRRRRRRTAR
jgi:DNA-nicking Smr family endonuclease